MIVINDFIDEIYKTNLKKVKKPIDLLLDTNRPIKGEENRFISIFYLSLKEF